MRTLFLVLVLNLIQVLANGVVSAETPIRVLLESNVQRLEISARTQLTVYSEKRTALHTASKIVFSPGSRHLLINGKVASVNHVWIRGNNQDLQVMMVKEAVVASPTKEHLQALRMFGKVSSKQLLAKARNQARQHTGASTPSRTQVVVGGDLHVYFNNSELSIVNVLNLEEYVKGVVPSEMNATWHVEALKVQAVAARTYALYQQAARRGQDYDVVATIQDQVYRGRAVVHERVNQAVEATRGLAVTFQGAPIFAAFSSTAAGPTEDASTVWSKELPYLKGVECPFDGESPYYQWKATFRIHQLERRLKAEGVSVGTIATLTPSAYSRAGRVKYLRILHSTGELLLRGEEFRRIVGYGVIPSTQFSIETFGPDVVLSGFGFGHAVGLCQWGVKQQAELGHSFLDILAYYYPGTDVTDTWQSRPPSE